MEKINKIYLGVYGINIKDNKILMIKKGRGPYTGLYDLPGGGLNFGEKIEECLKREIDEETGGTMTDCKFLANNEYSCNYLKNGELVDFQHLAIYYSVNISNNLLKTGPDGEDSLGAVFIPLEEVTNINTSPVAYPIIKKYFLG